MTVSGTMIQREFFHELLQTNIPLKLLDLCPAEKVSWTGIVAERGFQFLKTRISSVCSQAMICWLP